MTDTKLGKSGSFETKESISESTIKEPKLEL